MAEDRHEIHVGPGSFSGNEEPIHTLKIFIWVFLPFGHTQY